MRINKYVARATGMARRKVDSLIDGGQITVNGQPARIGQQISDSDVVALGSRKLKLPSYTYLKVHKPVGYVSSRQSQRGSKTIYDILPSQYRNLKLVGRLDKETSGLIILTDDGDFAHQLLHPTNNKSKIYELELDRDLSELGEQSLNRGVQLEDGNSYIQVLNNSKSKLRVELGEGRNRQIRRTFSAIGYEVVKLHRISIGSIELGTLKSGEFIEFSIADVDK